LGAKKIHSPLLLCSLHSSFILSKESFPHENHSLENKKNEALSKWPLGYFWPARRLNYNLRKKHRKNKEHAGLRQAKAGRHAHYVYLFLCRPVCPPGLFPSLPFPSLGFSVCLVQACRAVTYTYQCNANHLHQLGLHLSLPVNLARRKLARQASRGKHPEKEPIIETEHLPKLSDVCTSLFPLFFFGSIHHPLQTCRSTTGHGVRTSRALRACVL